MSNFHTDGDYISMWKKPGIVRHIVEGPIVVSSSAHLLSDHIITGKPKIIPLKIHLHTEPPKFISIQNPKIHLYTEPPKFISIQNPQNSSLYRTPKIHLHTDPPKFISTQNPQNSSLYRTPKIHLYTEPPKFISIQDTVLHIIFELTNPSRN